jgi:hypothetical protein
MIERLERDLALAEAALGGGLSIAVRAADGIDVKVRTDGVFASTPRAGEMLEAERTVEVAVPGVVEIEVFAGAADARKKADSLRRKWAECGRSVLEKAGVANASALREARERADLLARQAMDLTRESESVLREAATKHAGAGERYPSCTTL